MPHRLPSAVLALASAALLAGCAASPSSSGLTSVNPGHYAPPVFGSRTALSDPREQAPARAPAHDIKPRTSDTPAIEPPRSASRVASSRLETERPAATPPARHESVDTGRRKALDAARETDNTRPVAERPGTERPKAAAPPSKAHDPKPAGANVVEVAEGDTLLKIATRHKVSVSALMSANRLASLSVEPGQRLVIPKR